MKAVKIVKHGGVEGLELQEVEAPSLPGADRVRIRVYAAGVNRADLLQLRGHYPPPPGYPPDIPGLEFAGEIESVGPEARRWQSGKKVFGITAGGAQAEYIVVPESHLAEVPSNLDWVAAAAVPEVFITAHDAVFTQAGLRIGESLLVHAAGSGVGTAAIQLGSVSGARIIGTSRTAEKLKRAAELGMRHSVVIKDDANVFVAPVHIWTEGRGADVILDLVGGAYLEANLSALAPKGRMMLVGTTAGSKGMFNFGVAMSRRLTIIGTVLRARSLEEKATAVRLFESQVVPLLAEDIVRPIVDSVYPSHEVREAYRRLESNETFGKVVISF